MGRRVLRAAASPRIDLRRRARASSSRRFDGTVLDGLALTADGGLLVSCYRPDRIYHLGRDGRVEVVAEDPQGTLLAAPTNVCFAGPELDVVVSANLGRWHLTPHRDRPARRAAAPPGDLGGRRMSSPTDRFVPRYYEIEQALRARVAKLAPGDPLPSDAELCEEFGVSRMTARNAVATARPGRHRLPRSRGAGRSSPSSRSTARPAA